MDKPNPYESPIHSPVQSTADEQAIARIIKLLGQTRPWLVLISLLGFMATGSVGITVFASIAFVREPTAGGFAFNCARLLLAAIAYAMPSLYLWHYASRIADPENFTGIG